MSLLVGDRARDRLLDRWPRLLAVREVPVLDEPRDGLRPDLTLWPTPEQSVGYRPNPPRPYTATRPGRFLDIDRLARE